VLFIQKIAINLSLFWSRYIKYNEVLERNKNSGAAKRTWSRSATPKL